MDRPKDIIVVLMLPLSWRIRFLNRSLRSHKRQGSEPPFLYQLVKLHWFIFYTLGLSFHPQKLELH